MQDLAAAESKDTAAEGDAGASEADGRRGIEPSLSKNPLFLKGEKAKSLVARLFTGSRGLFDRQGSQEPDMPASPTRLRSNAQGESRRPASRGARVALTLPPCDAAAAFSPVDTTSQQARRTSNFDDVMQFMEVGHGNTMHAPAHPRTKHRHHLHPSTHAHPHPRPQPTTRISVSVLALALPPTLSSELSGRGGRSRPLPNSGVAPDPWAAPLAATGKCGALGSTGFFPPPPRDPQRLRIRPRGLPPGRGRIATTS